jgi:predicted transcriptional regulator
MTKLLDQAIAKVRELTDEEQDDLARTLLAMLGHVMDDETRAAIREGLAQAERGEFVADEVIAESDKRHGI